MVRTWLGALAALVVAILAQGIANWLGNLVFPAPPIANPLDRDLVAAAFAQRSTGNIALITLSYFVGALAGGWAGVAIARTRWVAWVAAGVMLLFAVIVVLTYPNPGWATALALAGPIAAALIVRHLAPAGAAGPLAPYESTIEERAAVADGREDDIDRDARA